MKCPRVLYLVVSKRATGGPAGWWTHKRGAQDMADAYNVSRRKGFADWRVEKFVKGD